MPLKRHSDLASESQNCCKAVAGRSSGKKHWEHWLLKLIFNLAPETYIPKAIPTAAQIRVFLKIKAYKRNRHFLFALLTQRATVP